jgi:hypothetical protein
MGDSDKEMQLVLETVTGSLSGSGVDDRQVMTLMADIMGLLRDQGVPIDSTGIVGLTAHVANFISRSRSGVEVDYPTGFEDQIPKEDILLALEVVKLITASTGYEVPRPEIALVASHTAAMRQRCQGLGS